MAEYKQAEEKYKKVMGVHQKKMGEVQDKFKSQIDSSIGKEIKKAEKEKELYDNACKNVGELSM